VTLGRATKRQTRQQGQLEVAFRAVVRQQGKADSTADCYWEWTEKYIRWVAAREKRFVHPKDLGKLDVEQYLSWLSNHERVSSGTQNQAFAALCYLYRWIVKQPLENVSALRSKRPVGTREVVDQAEIVALFSELSGVPLLCARMMYGSSFRIGELANIRIKDISFERKQITVRAGKGKKDRMVGFPEILHESVRRQIDSMRVLWQSDVSDGLNGVSLPDAYGRKSPGARLDFAWWYLFSADQYSKCPHTGSLYRHHRDMDNVGRIIHKAAVRCGCSKRITSHCLRHSFATHSLENGVPIHVLQKLMGHTDIRTTETYLHVTKDGVTSAKSPLESLLEDPQSVRREKPSEPFKIRLFSAG